MSGILNAVVGGGGAVAAATDAYFKNTTLLLHGDGTNGAQNNTFLDSSSNNFTITRNGNTTQGTFSPFSLPDGRWSNYFNQSAYLYNTSTSVGSFGTNNFTVECWLYVSGATGSQRFIYDTRQPGIDTGTYLLFDASNNINFILSGTTIASTSSANYPLNQWFHLAICKTGTGSNQVTMYINGVSTATGTINSSITSHQLGIGAGTDAPLGVTPFLGYISNLRFVNGTAVYTANFTPPTSPLTAITNTTLLTCQSNRYVDNSASSVTLTVSGSPSVQAYSPFAPTAAYSATTNGGSGYFDGSGDYLSVPNNTTFDITGTFTVELWYYQTASGTQYWFNRGGGAASWSTSNGVQYMIYSDSTYLYWQFNTSGGTTTIQTALPSLNTWHHLAIGYNGTTTRMWVDGLSVGTSTAAYTVPTTTNLTYIGNAVYTNGYYTGYMSSFRFVKGTDVYGVGNTSFTPPTSPLTAITNTSLLLSCTNAGIKDNTAKNDLETVGNAQISTTQSKFGGSSMYFDGTGDYLLAPSTTNWDFGTGDLTVEFWVYLSSVTNCSFIGKWGSGAGKYAWITQYETSTSSLRFYTGNNGTLGTLYSFSWSPSTGIWYHVAFTRSGSSLRAFINGNQIGSTQTNSDALTASGAFCCIGENLDGGGQSQFANGYIDDLRITKGVARYTSNFTVPSAAFPDK